jgi:hypothetical protein
MRQKTPDITKPVLLVFDGHGSHKTKEFIEHSVKPKHNIRLYCLPPKTTHKLQPLDVGCFGNVKNAWRLHCAEYLLTHGIAIPRHQLVNEYLAVQDLSLTPAVVRRAWKLTGLVPLNPGKWTDKDFAPAQLTSCITHLPASFVEGSSTTPVSVTPTAEGSGDFFSSACPSPCDTMSLPAPSIMSFASSASVSFDWSSIDDITPPRIVPGMSNTEKLIVYEQHALKMTDRARQESEKAQTIAAQRDLLCGENTKLRNRAQAAIDARKRPRKTIAYNGGWLNSEKNKAIGDEHFAKEAAAELEQAAAERAKKDREDEAERTRQAKRTDSGIQYAGFLKNMRRPELQDICCLLDLPYKDSKLTCIKLANSVRAKLLKSPELLEDARFAGLEQRRRKQAPSPSHNDASDDDVVDYDADEDNMYDDRSCVGASAIQSSDILVEGESTSTSRPAPALPAVLGGLCSLVDPLPSQPLPPPSTPRRLRVITTPLSPGRSGH